MQQKRIQRWAGRKVVATMLTVLAVSCLSGLETAKAQFHAKTQDGRTVAAAQPTTGTMNNPNAPTVYRGEMQNAGFIDTGAVEGATLGYTDFRNAVIWGRAVFHNDGTYTESKQDEETNSLTQITKSENGVTLQRRLISLDAKGRPSEVLIYDGRGNYKYRGQILYDLRGNFREEQIYDTNSQLLRRRIQEYDLKGNPKRLKVIDDLSKIPADMKLVITRLDGYNEEAAQANQERFWQEAQRRDQNAAPPASGGGNATTPAKEKPGLLKRFFGRD